VLNCFLATVPAEWTRTWKLNVKKSIFAAILFPGAPADLKIVSQTLKIQHADSDLRRSGETVFPTTVDFTPVEQHATGAQKLRSGLHITKAENGGGLSGLLVWTRMT
jgi:hypothetical protein